MPSVFETVTSLLGQGNNMDKLAASVGSDAGQTGTLLSAAAPALLGGVADKAAEPGGIGAVMGMLDGADDSMLGNLGGFLDKGDSRAGAGMLDGIFGDSQGGLVNALASQTGAGPSTIGRFLPMLAPIVLGALKSRRASDGLDGSGMMSLLAKEKDDLNKKGAFDFGWMSKAGMGAAGAAAATGAAVKAGGNKVTDTGRGAVKSATGTVRETGTAVGGRAGSVDTPNVGGSGRGRNWLPLILGGLAAVLLLGWALSQCGDGDGIDTGAIGDVADDAVDAVEDVADDATEAVGDAADEAVEAVEETAEEVVDAFDRDTVQGDVDSSLSGLTGVDLAGAVDDGGVVTLTGTVDSDEAKAAAEAAAAGVDGVSSVNNQIIVEAAEEEEAEEDAAATINEELSLDPITFEVSSAEITAEGQAVLDQAAAYLDANADVSVEIAGHTDADGSDASNMALSQARAESVKAYLEASGIDGARMTPQGYGETQPVASNDTTDGKAENRRIEFVIQ